MKMKDVFEIMLLVFLVGAVVSGARVMLEFGMTDIRLQWLIFLAPPATLSILVGVGFAIFCLYKKCTIK